LNFEGPLCGWRSPPLPSSFCQTSSRPNVSRVGTPVGEACVGSGSIQALYQAWMPGQYSSAHAVPDRAEPVVGSRSVAASAISFHVRPKSLET
jgi:hypothetical protein